MKISYNLLRKYVDLPSDPHKIAAEIAEHCFEVENIEEFRKNSPRFSGVFAAKVLSKEKHPNADRLKVVELDLGDRQISPVVCGADNFVPGDMVALALPGAFIPQNVHSEEHESFTLGSAVIRGVQSQGMICSEFELGLRDTPEEKPEVLVLPGKIEPGTDLKNFFGGKGKADDYLIEFSLPANRPDLHSHIGIAREIVAMIKSAKATALLKKTLAAMDKPKFPSPKSGSSVPIKAEIKTDKCAAILLARLQVKIVASDPEISEPLKTLGHGGINNVVDITNFVMSETGQPLHAYDAYKVKLPIIVREAKENAKENANETERVEALDGKTYEVPKGSLLITDSSEALGLAGIIGGMKSSITNQTDEIILEAAVFDSVSVRRTSKAVGLRTDASSLFEKGNSLQLASYGLIRAIQLLQEKAGAELISVSQVIGKQAKAGQKNKSVSFSAEEINDILGTELSESAAKKLFAEIGIEVSGTKGKLQAIIPWYRNDIEDAAGLADEIARRIGMNEIPKTPLRITRQNLPKNAEEKIWKAKEVATRLGYSEIQTYSFLSEAEIKNTGGNPKDFIKVTNPLSSETEYLRKDLFPSMLKVISLNAKFSEKFKLFEVGYGYNGYLDEDLLLCLSIYNSERQQEYNLAELKGDVEALLKSFGLDSDFGKQEEQKIRILRSADLQSGVAAICLNLQKVINESKPSSFKAFGKFPTSSLDTSLVVSEKVGWAEIRRIAEAASGDLLKGVVVLDAPYFYAKNDLPQFHKNMLKEGKKNIVFRLVFGSENRTLNRSEINQIYDIIIQGLKHELKAEIR